MISPRLALNVGVLATTLEQKLVTTTRLGFSTVALSNSDLSGQQQNLTSSTQQVQHSPLKVSAFHELKDFLGHPEHLSAYRFKLARAHLSLMAEIGATLLIVTPGISNIGTIDTERMVAELRALALLATTKGIRIGFKPLPWSPVVSDYQHAWSLIQACDNANLSLVLDSLYCGLEGGAGIDDILEQVPVDRIGLIQLSDFNVPHFISQEIGPELERARYLPSNGVLGETLEQWVIAAENAGYRGTYALQASADGYRNFSQTEVQAAIQASSTRFNRLI